MKFTLRKEKPCIGLVVKHEHPLAYGLTSRLVNWFEEHKYPFRLDSQLGPILNRSDVTLSSREEIAEHCAIIVVLGGDGTLISVSRHAGETPPAIIGVNLGTLGFLTEITVEELFPTLESVLAGKARLDKRKLLQATVYREKQIIDQYTAINDVVITKEALARIFGVQVSVNGKQAASLRGDGVIVSTPSGSTAYSLAAGGSIVHPEVEALLITPICPHSLTSRPLVIPSNFELKLTIQSGSMSGTNQVYLTIDGQAGRELTHHDEIFVTTSRNSVSFVKSPSRDYFEVLGTKLKWANT